MTSKTIQDHIKLNVGGIKYETTLNTITSDTDSMLANMFSGRHPMKLNDDGYYFIDRDGDIFKYVVKYLRDKKLNIDDIDILTIKNIKDEAEYFQIEGLIELCHQKTSDSSFMLTPELKYIFDNIIKFDIKAFEKDFNEVFSIDKLSKYPYSIEYIDTDYTLIYIELKKIFEHIQHYDAILQFSQKWNDVFPEPNDLNIDKKIPKFNKIVRLMPLKSTFSKILLHRFYDYYKLGLYLERCVF
jgi:hypothetical protein